MEKFSITVLVVLLALVGMAQADSTQTEAPSSLVVGQVATVQGVVRFEEHHTIIPMIWCSPTAHLPCVASRPYWSVVIDNGSNQFEIDERFAMDQTVAPDAVELAGATIHSGQAVRVEATVEYAGTNYYILGSVRNVNEVLDYSTVSLPNWTCRGTVDRDTEIQADVWYTGASGGSQGNQYTLRLAGTQNSQQDHRLFQLASLSDAQGFTSRDQLVYQGQSAAANVELVIDHPGDSDVNQLSEVSGHLTFALSQLPTDEHSRIQAQGDFPVVCGRTR